MSQPPHRVAITGIGILSCFGAGKSVALQAVREGRSGIRHLTSIDASSLQCRIGGEVPEPAHAGRERGDRFARFALIAAAEAAEQAAFGSAGVEPERIGAIIGTGLGGCETLDAGYQRIYRDAQTRLPPTSIAWSMYNAATSAVSARFNAQGVSYAVVSACSSSLHALGSAAQAIRSGEMQMMFTGGSDAPLVFGIIRAWESMRVLAIDNEQPERASRPFSADRRGLVLAEGAAVFVLEEMQHALDRGAEVLGEIAGFGATSDAGHLTDPSPAGAARAMRLALKSGGVEPSAVGYINAHGTATRANDASETAAIKEVFGAHAYRIPVSSTKSMHGHAMGASGAIETAISLLSLNEGWIAPTINLDTPDPELDLDFVPNASRPGQIGLFLSNSFGFGGMNAAVAMRTRFG